MFSFSSTYQPNLVRRKSILSFSYTITTK